MLLPVSHLEAGKTSKNLAELWFKSPVILRDKLFCGFPGYKPVPPGWFKIVCWFYVGNTQRLTESGFMEKPGIEPATPGLQGIALIHYTTAAYRPINKLMLPFYF